MGKVNPHPQAKIQIPNHGSIGSDLVADTVVIPTSLVLIFNKGDYRWFYKAMSELDAEALAAEINRSGGQNSAVRIDIPLVVPSAEAIRQLCEETGSSGFNVQAKKRRVKMFLGFEELGGATNE